MTRRLRGCIAAAGVALLVVAALAGWRAATALDRNWTPLDVPLRLEAGTTIVRPVRLDRTGHYRIEVAIPRDAPDVERAIGGGFFDEAEGSPPGVGIAYSLSRDGHVVEKGKTGDRLSGAWGRDAVSVLVADVKAEAGDYEIRAEVTRTSPALLDQDTRLVVDVDPNEYKEAHIEAHHLPQVAWTYTSLGALLLGVFEVSRRRSLRARTT